MGHHPCLRSLSWILKASGEPSLQLWLVSQANPGYGPMALQKASEQALT